MGGGVKSLGKVGENRHNKIVKIRTKIEKTWKRDVGIHNFNNSAK